MFDPCHELQKISIDDDIARTTNGPVHTQTVWDDVVVTDEGTLDQLSFELYAANSMISGVPFRAYAKSEFVHSTRLYSRWVSWGRFLPAHARHASLIPSLHDHASDCFAALSECKTRSGRSIVVVCFGLKAIFMIADCYRVAIQTRLCNEILGITSVFLRK